MDDPGCAADRPGPVGSAPVCADQSCAGRVEDSDSAAELPEPNRSKRVGTVELPLSSAELPLPINWKRRFRPPDTAPLPVSITFDPIELPVSADPVTSSGISDEPNPCGDSSAVAADAIPVPERAIPAPAIAANDRMAIRFFPMWFPHLVAVVMAGRR